jgi:hypothetical protein
MKKFISAILWKLLSPSHRFAIREFTAWLLQLVNRACIWRWQIVKFLDLTNTQYTIIYAGRKDNHKLLAALMRVRSDVVQCKLSEISNASLVLVSDLPIPRALCVPQFLSTVIPTDISLTTITDSYSSELKNYLRKQRKNFFVLQKTEISDVDEIEQTMLRPYTVARHDDDAVQLTSAEIRKFSKPDFGKLDIIYLEEKAVACHLGCGFSYRQKKYWHSLRFGYPEPIFSNRKKLGDINSMNTYLAMEWAVNNGFDYYDLGISKAIPDGGLLHWKKRRKGNLDTLGNHSFFYVKLPHKGAAEFLFKSPLFTVENEKLCLHLGVPQEIDFSGVKVRYREMGFGGLSKVYLHCTEKQKSESMDYFSALYSYQTHAPEIIEILHVRA